jgi:hypothetical protein
MIQLRKAERKQSKIRLALQGGSGSGKSYGSILIAKGLAGTLDKVAVIDSEHHSADLYAHLGSYSVLPIEPPFSPEKYIQAIKLCEDAGMEIIILDSISHQWEGEGGILDVHSSMMGNSFTNWNKLTPRHNKFINAILQSKCHVIATIRSKQDYILSNINGKMVPEKVGLKGVAREGTDYEFTVVLELNQKHSCTASKDRTGLFSDKPEFIITETTGKQIKDWCQALPRGLSGSINRLTQNINTTTNGINSIK